MKQSWEQKRLWSQFAHKVSKSNECNHRSHICHESCTNSLYIQNLYNLYYLIAYLFIYLFIYSCLYFYYFIKNCPSFDCLDLQLHSSAKKYLQLSAKSFLSILHSYDAGFIIVLKQLLAKFLLYSWQDISQVFFGKHLWWGPLIGLLTFELWPKEGYSEPCQIS